MGRSIVLALAASAAIWVGLPAAASDFPYRRNVSLVLGGSVVLKGVRSGDCSATAPSWNQVAPGLPASRLGVFSNGGTGTVHSNACGKRVGARGVRFTARTKGSESFNVFDDVITVTVN